MNEIKLASYRRCCNKRYNRSWNVYFHM